MGTAPFAALTPAPARAAVAAPPAGSSAVAAPTHVAIIMDGNGRWATLRGQPRPMGHPVGARVARAIIRAARDRGAKVLTLFAFSQENWQRPLEEVRLLMRLFVRTLKRELAELHAEGVKIRFIGERGRFDPLLREVMDTSETRTASNPGMTLVIALGYSGRWDIAQAAAKLAAKGLPITPEALDAHLDTAGLPEPDLVIRTGGEWRVSNFLLWQGAYSELFFTDTLWPDFTAQTLDAALAWYAGRQRRFGRVPGEEAAPGPVGRDLPPGTEVADEALDAETLPAATPGAGKPA